MHTTSSNFKYGTLPSTSPVVIGAGTMPVPFTITLTSAAGGRLIELSTDGTNFFTPTYDATTAAMITVAVKAPIKVFRLTGAANDTWSTR